MQKMLEHRLPDRQSVLQLFYACILVVEAWALFNLLREIPALRYRETGWDMIGIIAIVQLMALVESVIVTMVLICAAALLPARLFRQHFLAQATLILVVSAVWAIAIHTSQQAMTTWTKGQFGLWGGLYLLALAVIPLLLHRFAKLETAIQKLVQNGALLAQVYLSLSLLASFIVLLRRFL